MIQTILNSPVDQQLTDSIALVHYHQLPILLIKHPTCYAAIALQGAHLLFWHPKQTNQPVIWLSEKSEFNTGNAIRGGVPICWPHFAERGEPKHGFARLLPWQLITYQENTTSVKLSLQLKNSSASQPYLKKPFCLTTTIELGSTCHMSLTCQAELEATTALHTYFNVSDISHIKISGLGDQYQERLTTINPPATKGEVTFNQEVDRIYTAPEPVSILHDIDRTVKITHVNASDIVVWNPWVEKCNTIPDMQAEGYKQMACIETSRINKPLNCAASPELTTIGFTIELI